MAYFPDNFDLPSSLQEQLLRITGCSPKTLDDGRILIMSLPCTDYNHIARPKNLSLWQNLAFTIWSMFAMLPPCLDRLPEAKRLGYRGSTLKALEQAKEAIDVLGREGHAVSIEAVKIDWFADGILAIQIVDFGVVIARPQQTNQLPRNGAK